MPTTTPRAISRTFVWTAAIVSIALGCVAALVGLLDTQRVCFGFDEMCDGPKWGDAVVAFAVAAVLFALAVDLVVRVRHRRTR